MIIISSFFTSYYSLLFCTSIEIMLHKIGAHCPLCSLTKKVTKTTNSVHCVHFLEQKNNT